MWLVFSETPLKQSIVKFKTPVSNFKKSIAWLFCHLVLSVLILQESYDDCQLCKCHQL